VSRKQPHVLLALGWYDHRVHQGIAKYALEAGWHLCTDVTKEKVIPWGWKGDGILAWLAGDDELAKFVIEMRLPAVDFSFRRAELPLPRVLSDHAATARLVAEHFMVRGFRHFAFYSSTDNWAFNEAGQAYGEELEAAGRKCAWLKWHLSPAFSMGRQQWADKRKWLAGQLKASPKPLALYAASDDHALEVVEVCEAVGLAIPDEVAVVGMGNAIAAVEAMRTPVSSVDEDFAMQGYRGAELLDRLMQGRPAPPRPIRIPPAGLIVRKSSDLLAVAHLGVAKALRFIWENCDKPIGVEDVVAAAAMSRSALHQAFVEHIGRPPGSELHRVRIEMAKKLLRSSSLKLETLSENCGFRSANSFWVAFKQATGVSPRQYKKLYCY